MDVHILLPLQQTEFVFLHQEEYNCKVLNWDVCMLLKGLSGVVILQLMAQCLSMKWYAYVCSTNTAVIFSGYLYSLTVVGLYRSEPSRPQCFVDASRPRAYMIGY
jgi:hypothetical protein